jgi:peptide/nickel transport system permease protein
MSALLHNRRALIGLGIFGCFVLLATIGPLFVVDPNLPIAVPSSPPSWAHWFGTTGQGQDVFAQTLVGARMSLLIGFAVGLLQVAVGALVGTTAGYFGGWVDDVLSTTVNVFLIMPGLPLMVILAAYLPATPTTAVLVLFITGWAWSARVIRSQAMSLREKDFVLAATVSGEPSWRIIVCHIMPNMTSLLASSFIGATIYAIGAQVALEFLGLGNMGKITWGSNLFWAQNDGALMTGSWWMFVPTGVSVALVGFSLALINNAIDELGNPRLRAEDAFQAAARAEGVTIGVSTPVLRGRAP